MPCSSPAGWLPCCYHLCREEKIKTRMALLILGKLSGGMHTMGGQMLWPRADEIPRVSKCGYIDLKIQTLTQRSHLVSELSAFKNQQDMCKMTMYWQTVNVPPCSHLARTIDPDHRTCRGTRIRQEPTTLPKKKWTSEKRWNRWAASEHLITVYAGLQRYN